MWSLGPRASDRQKELIITFLEEHPALVRLQCLRRTRGLGPELTVADRQRLWRQLAAKTNAEGPLSKTANQWQLWWRKQVHDARQRAAAVKDNERITGFCYLSKWRQRILNLVGRLPHTSCPACEAHEDSQYEVVVYQRYSVFTALNWQQVDSNNAAPLPVMFPLGSEETVAQALLQLHHNAERFAQSLDTSSVFTIHMTSSRTYLGFQALRGMKDATVRQAAALERLAEEVSQQRAVAERQTAALEHLVEELKGFRSIGNLARAISTAFQQQVPESQ
ncbi:hypothetical protein HPB50_007321 [Hyalomma asiaticum]|uniref:Uncharacterized protein n=1 Tax=Hyalomma asiaticum TaxID=266040 RepID=A0ACB7STI4_HYAAI|nr:hypothetical protein HPB50_007321 [Hyalomma asiaticum]